MLVAVLCIVGKGVALADVITDPAQLSNNKVYTIRTARGALILNFDETMLVSSHASNGENENGDVSESEGADQFAILKFGDFYYIYSPLLEQFAELSGQSMVFQSRRGTGLTFHDDGNEFEGTTLRFFLEEENYCLNNNNSGGIVLNGWTTADDGNTMAIEEVPGATFDLAKAEEIFGIEKPEYEWWALLKDMHKVFHLSTPRVGNFCSDSEHTKLSSVMETPDATEEDQQFAFWVDDEGKVYLFNVGANMFLDKNGNFTSIPSEMAEIGYEEETNEDYPIVFYIKETGSRFNSQSAGWVKFTDTTWRTHDEGNIIGIEEVSGEDAYDQMVEFFSAQRFNTTYRLIFNGEEIATCVRESPYGSDAQLPADMKLESCWYEYDPEVITSDGDVTVNVYWEGPEDLFSPDLENANWYNLMFDHEDGDGRGGIWYAWYEEGKEPYVPEKDLDDAMLAAAQSQWAFIGNPYAVKIYNKSAGESQTLSYDQMPNPRDPSQQVYGVVLREGEHTWIINDYIPETDEFSLGVTIDGTFYRVNQHGGASTTSFFGLWSGYDDGSKLKVTEAPWMEVTDVYFDIYYEGQKVATQKVIGQQVGDWIPELPSSLNAAFVELDYDEDQSIDYEDYHVDIQATWVGPFELSKDFASAHWYDMSVRKTWYVTSDQTDDDGALKTVNANALGLAEDAYQWALVGDPWNIKLYNKAMGSGVCYSWTTTGSQSIPTFVDAAEANAWVIKKIISDDEDFADAFMFTVPGHNDQVNQYGGAGGSLKQWNSTATGDPGSAFMVFDVPDDFAEYVASEIAPSMESTWFGWTDAARSAIGYQESYKESCPLEKYKSMKLAIEDLKADESNFVFPPSGIYRLQSKYYGDFFGYVSEAPMAEEEGTSASTVVILNKVGDHEYTIQCQGEYLQPLTRSETMYTDPAYPETFTAVVPEPGFAAFTATPMPDEADEEAMADYTYSFLHRRAQGDYVGWEKNADASKFRLLDAKTLTLEVGAEGIASLYVPFAVLSPEGLAAFKGKIEDDQVRMTGIKGLVPANTPVVILAEEGTYEMNISNDASAPAADNDLKGVYIQSRPSYALAPQSAGAEDCFFASTGEDLPANTAYVKLADTSVEEIPMVFDDYTGIKSLEDNENHTMYDLSGRRVNKTNKGVYIIDGKKMMVK